MSELKKLENNTKITHFADAVFVVKDKNKKDINYLATGSSLAVTQTNGETDDFTIVVEGDTNGDGVCDVLDVSETERIANGHKEYDILQCYAANGCVSEFVDISAYQNVVNKALYS